MFEIRFTPEAIEDLGTYSTMKTIKISRRSKGVELLLKQALRENVVLRSPEGHEFILAEVHDFDREIELARQNRALMKFLDSRARQTETVSWEEARSLLGLTGSSARRESRENKV